MHKVMYFKATWCAPCRAVGEQLAKLTVPVETIDIDEDGAKATALGIRSVPTVVLFVNNAPVGQFMGSTAAKQLQSVLSKY